MRVSTVHISEKRENFSCGELLGIRNGSESPRRSAKELRVLADLFIGKTFLEDLSSTEFWTKLKSPPPPHDNMAVVNVGEGL